MLSVAGIKRARNEKLFVGGNLNVPIRSSWDITNLPEICNKLTIKILIEFNHNYEMFTTLHVDFYFNVCLVMDYHTMINSSQNSEGVVKCLTQISL